MDEWEEEILKIALCQKYQSIYSDIAALCDACGLTYEDKKQIEGWKYHHKAADPLILRLILDYIQDYEKERYDKALHLYNKR